MNYRVPQAQGESRDHDNSNNDWQGTQRRTTPAFMPQDAVARPQGSASMRFSQVVVEQIVNQKVFLRFHAKGFV